MRRSSRRPRARVWWWCALLLASLARTEASSDVIDVVVNLRGAEAVSEDPLPLPSFQYMSNMDNSDVFVALCTPGTFSPDHEGVCHDCTVCRPGEQFEKLPCIPVRDRTCHNCTLCSDREIELCQCSVKTTQCVTGDRVCVKVVPTSVTLTIDLTAKSILTSRQQTLLKSGLSTGYADWLGLQFSLDPLSIELTNFVRLDQLNYKATFTFTEVYGEATVARIKTSPPEFYQGGLAYTFGGTGRRRLLGVSQAGRRLLQSNSVFLAMNLGSTTFSCNASESSCTDPFTKFTVLSNGTGCTGTCNPMCPPGYGAVSGAQKCEPCSEGYFKNETAFTLCTPCPDGFPLSPAGSNSSEACVAAPTSTTPLTSSELSSTSSQSAPSQTSTALVSSSGPSQTSTTSASLTPAQTAAATASALTSPSSGQTSSSASSQSTSGSASSSSSSAPSQWSSALPLPSTSLAPPSTSSQSTQSMQPPSSSSPSSAGGGTGGGSAASNSAIASNANTDTNDNVNTISPTVNSNSDSHQQASASSESHAQNNANNAITVNVPSGASQPIFNRNVVNVVLPPAQPPMPAKDDYYYDRDYHRRDSEALDSFSYGFVIFSLFFVIIFCMVAAYLALQPPAPPLDNSSPDRRVIRYRLIRIPPGEGGV